MIYKHGTRSASRARRMIKSGEHDSPLGQKRPAAPKRSTSPKAAGEDYSRIATARTSRSAA